MQCLCQKCEIQNDVWNVNELREKEGRSVLSMICQAVATEE